MLDVAILVMLDAVFVELDIEGNDGSRLPLTVRVAPLDQLPKREGLKNRTNNQLKRRGVLFRAACALTCRGKATQRLRELSATINSCSSLAAPWFEYAGRSICTSERARATVTVWEPHSARMHELLLERHSA